MRPFLFILASLSAAWPLLTSRGGGVEPQPTPLREHAHFRRPIAAAWLEPGRICVVANGRSGTLSRVDVERRVVLDEQLVAKRLADIVRLGDSQHFLLLDDKTHELIVVHYDAAGQIVFDGRTDVSPFPIKVAVSADGAEAAVTCLWSRTIDVIALRPSDSATPAETWNAAFPKVVATIALPFNPRDLAFLPDGDRLLVAAAFGGKLAAIDWKQRRVAAVHEINGHNLRGLFVDAESRKVTFVGQFLNQRLPTDLENVSRGALMKNRLWRIDDRRLFEPQPLLQAEIQVVELDQNRIGAADPSSVVRTSRGESLVVSAGTSILSVMDSADVITARFQLGDRPQALLTTPDERFAVIVNQLSDSLSVIELNSSHSPQIPLGPKPGPFPRDRGEQLFFDARYSAKQFMSCHSCHTDGHANGLMADTLGDGEYGNPKRVISLRGTALTDHWSWNGQLRELRDQVRQSLETTMHARPLGPEQHDDVVAFLHTLPFAPPPESKPRDEADRRLLERGRTLFETWKCGSCHIGPLTYTTQGTFDVGLRDERGLAKFNPPSLRGVGQGAGFFHDNRATMLGDVLHVYRHQVPDDAVDADLDAVVRFLRGL